jgi:murein L,D-transpeptidase YafK
MVRCVLGLVQRRWAVAVCAGLLWVGQARRPSTVPSSSQAISPKCGSRDTQVVVRSAARRMYLCERGHVAKTYRVGLGSRGVGKRKEGDKKTPVGQYRLSPSRPSVSGVRTFIHVGYPTLKQRRAGYTGGAIGIHGPSRNGRLRSTQGCIAVRTNDEIDEIAAWVDHNRVRRISIE